jgi:thiopeptide-type bacteriocin biosynthesis protein
MARPKVRYIPDGPVLLRVSTRPQDLPGPAPDDPADARSWLTSTWAHPAVAEAVGLVSADLATRIDQVLTGAGSAAAVVRCARALSGYLTRWRERTTPLGMFAAVGVTVVGPPALPFGRPQAIARADADWLTAVIAPLSGDRLLRERLTLTADSSATLRGGRLHLRVRPGTSGRSGQERSVRYTPAVAAALQAATNPVAFSALVTELTEQLGAGQAQITGLLHALTDSGFLISSLHAPATTTDPLARLQRVLTGTGLEHLEPVCERLAEIRDLLDQHNRCAGEDEARALRSRLDTLMRVTATSTSVLAVDMRLDRPAQLPENVLSEAARAANLLIQVCTEPFGSPAWVDYHARFRSRYGVGAAVPVRELLADSGLGYPAGYLEGPPARRSWREVTDRDSYLLNLVQQALVNGHDEIELTGHDVQALTVGDHGTATFPDRIEFGFSVHADSAQALREGRFDLHVTGAPRSCTSMAARFAYLLPDADRDALARTYSTDGRSTAALLAFAPRQDHDFNITRTGRLLPDVICVGECGEHATIAVGDLAVTADQEQFYLIHRTTGRRIVARIPHALELTSQTPVLARFLAEITESRSVQFGPFSLGAAGRVLAYTPRIRSGSVVLSPRRWRLAASDLPDPSRPAAWEEQFARWRARWKVPARVVVINTNLHQTADLDRAADRAAIRAGLHVSDLLELREDPSAGRDWPDRPAEWLSVFRPALPQRLTPPVTTAPADPVLPGDGTVIHAHLTGNPLRFDELLSSHLPDVLNDLAGLGVQHWWASRSRNLISPHDDQHLTVTVRLSSPDDHPKVAQEFAAFCARLRTQGLPWKLTLHPYQPHTGRYGTGPAAEAAEAVFAADTLAAAAQLRAGTAAGVSPQVMCALSMLRIATAFEGARPADGLRALLAVLSPRTRPADRELTDRVRAFAADQRQISHLPDGAAVAAAWDARDTTLRRYRNLLPPGLHPDLMLATLLHDHHIRAVGVGPEAEQATNHLARSGAARVLAGTGRP